LGTAKAYHQGGPPPREKAAKKEAFSQNASTGGEGTAKEKLKNRNRTNGSGRLGRNQTGKGRVPRHGVHFWRCLTTRENKKKKGKLDEHKGTSGHG